MRLFGLELPAEIAAAVKTCREHMVLAAILSALINLLYLTPTIYMLQVYDRVVPTAGVVTLVWLTLITLLALATLAALDGIRMRIMVRAGLRLDKILASTILDRVISQSRVANNKQNSSQALRDFDTMRQSFSGAPMLALFDAPWTPIYILVAFMMHYVLGLVAIFSVILMLGLTILNERATRAGSKSAIKMLTNSYATQERIASQAELIRALGMRTAVINQHMRDRVEGLELTREHQFIGGNYTAIAKFFRLFLQSFALGIGAWLAVIHEISMGSIIAASVLLNRALAPIEQMVAYWKSFLESRQAIENLRALFETSTPSHVNAFTLPRPRGSISCQNVSIVRGGDLAPALNQLSFVVEPGEIVGIIGHSGAGKSTLMRVLAGAISPDYGTVRIDGANMSDWDQDDLARHCGYLPQDSALLPGTIADNISRFALSSGSNVADVEKAVLEATRIARVHDLILSLPGGYDMRIGWNGEGLSVGQRQRIGLARAVYGMPSILILDEPNAALDASGEEALMAALETMKARGATILIAAHRASVLATASRLMLLVDGSIHMYGPTELVRARLNAPVAAAEPQQLVTETVN